MPQDLRFQDLAASGHPRIGAPTKPEGGGFGSLADIAGRHKWRFAKPAARDVEGAAHDPCAKQKTETG
jgi:hypothetical protein